MTFLSLGIPPGQGKPETQNRNVRRRRARQLKKLGEIGPDVPTAPASGDDALQVFGTPTLTTPGIVPSDMANRNKKKGFLREMRELRGSKTVFDERRDDTVPEATVNGDDVLDISVMEMAAAQEEKRSGRWPIPPSERSGLPSNVFVTSQEFKRTRVDRRPNGHAEKDVRAEVEEEEEMEGVQEEAIQNGHSEIDEAMELWKRAEADYETLEALNSDKLELLKAGSLIAWKVRDPA